MRKSVLRRCSFTNEVTQITESILGLKIQHLAPSLRRLGVYPGTVRIIVFLRPQLILRQAEFSTSIRLRLVPNRGEVAVRPPQETQRAEHGRLGKPQYLDGRHPLLAAAGPSVEHNLAGWVHVHDVVGKEARGHVGGGGEPVEQCVEQLVAAFRVALAQGGEDEVAAAGARRDVRKVHTRGETNGRGLESPLHGAGRAAWEAGGEDLQRGSVGRVNGDRGSQETHFGGELGGEKRGKRGKN